MTSVLCLFYFMLLLIMLLTGYFTPAVFYLFLYCCFIYFIIIIFIVLVVVEINSACFENINHLNLGQILPIPSCCMPKSCFSVGS